VFIAGGRALSMLLSIPANDTDYFSTKLINPSDITNVDEINVNQYVITFNKCHQLIKRLYKMPHEIIHSFDIDCCCIMINYLGEIYCSHRFMYSLMNGYNTVDFEYLSPSYEWRLIKYANRGFSISIPGVYNCDNDVSECVSDNRWSVADIQDILNGSMLKHLLINAKGFEKILIASSVYNGKFKKYLENSNNTKLIKLSSDYIDSSVRCEKVDGIIRYKSNEYYINGKLGYDENGESNKYVGKFKVSTTSGSYFTEEMNNMLIKIIFSDYQRVNPGEQTTSTFHKIVLENPNNWYKLDTEKLFIESMYTLLYAQNISNPPILYDQKVLWFSPNCIDLYIYHFGRIFLNNVVYDKFNNILIHQIKLSTNKNIADYLSYSNDSFFKKYVIYNGNKNGIFKCLFEVHEDFTIFTSVEYDLLYSLYRRTNPTDDYIKVEIR